MLTIVSFWVPEREGPKVISNVLYRTTLRWPLLGWRASMVNAPIDARFGGFLWSL